MNSLLLKDLNSEQKKAVTHSDGPTLIIAGAGTGKTAVISRRIAYLIEQGLAGPEEILALTFTEKASEEMDFRVYELLPKVFSSVSVFTFHGFADSVLRDIAYDVGLSPNYKILSKSQQILFLRSQIFNLNLKYFRPVSNPLKFLKDLCDFFSNLKEENVSSEDLRNFARNHDDEKTTQKYLELADAFEKYEEIKRLANVVDFADLIYLTKKAFTEYPKILQNYQNRYKYILVDEFQDTNLSQNELVNLLAYKSKNLAVVGDDDQSIYKFRGASISNILNFKKTYPDAKEFVLTTNYRSTQSILDLAYGVIQNNNPDRLEIANKINKKLISGVKIKGQPPKVIKGLTLSDEVEGVTKAIQDLLKNGIKLSEIAILSRASNHATPFIKSLKNQGIPVQTYDSFNLSSDPVIKDLIYFLKTISDFEDNLSVYHLAVSEYFNINAILVSKLSAYSRHRSKNLLDVFNSISDFTDFEISSNELVKINFFTKKIEEYILLSSTKNVTELLYQFLVDFKVIQKFQSAVKANLPIDISEEKKIANIAKFFTKISDFVDSSLDASVQSYIQIFNLMSESGDDSSTPLVDPDIDAVNVLTVHGSKGLEFRAVFIVNLVSERFPSRSKSSGIPIPPEVLKDSNPSDKNADLQEERRLFYVAVTRAKEYLYLSWSQDYGGARAKKPSQFLLEAFGKQDLEVVPVKLNLSEKINSFGVINEQLPLIPPQKKVTKKHELVHLTQDSINSYLTCPLQYKYNYHLNMPKSATPAMSFGTAIHKAIEFFYNSVKDSGDFTYEDFIAVYTENFSDIGFENSAHKKEFFQNGLQMLRNFYDSQKDIKYTDLFVEEKFSMVLEGAVITGRFDLITVQNKVTSILDFKTSHDIDEKKAKERVKKSIQLRIYALAYKKRFQKDADEMGLYFVESGILENIKPNDNTYLLAEKDITKVKEGILAEVFTPKPDKFSCENCPFNQICPASVSGG